MALKMYKNSPYKVVLIVILAVFNFFIFRHAMNRAEQEMYDVTFFNSAYLVNQQIIDRSQQRYIEYKNKLITDEIEDK